MRRSLLVLLSLLTPAAFGWNSSLVPVDANGRLSYVPDPTTGNRIPDFSNAGYRGGGIPLPTSIPVVKTLDPVAGDNTARIQAALNEVAALPLQADGYRGALRLNAGTYEVVGTLRINATGVVLAGVGNGDDPATNTILRRTGTSQAAIIQAGNRDDQFKGELAGTRSNITTARVAVGSRSFEVDHPEYYKAGDAVVIFHASTQAWIDAVDRGGVTDSNYWRPGEIDIRYHRYVTGVSGNTLTVDAPMFTNLDRSLSQSVVFKYDGSHVLRRMGIEKLQVDIVTKGELTEDHAEDAITFVGAEDSWIRDSTMKHFWHAGVQFEGSTRCTVERCRALEPHGPIDGGYRYNFSTYHAQLILFQDCFASYARHAYVCNGTSLDSGIVFLNSTIDHAYTSSEGHRRWTTAMLYDNITATARQGTDVLGLYNRGTYGTGHGWAAAHSVAWNCNAGGGRIWIQRAPTAQNYGIGCSGNITGTGPFAGPAGFIEGTNQSGLEPKSLYLAQLAQRLAETAAPQITRQPVSQTIAAGDTVVLEVGATGATSVQWKRGGAVITGATASSYVLTNVTTADSGDYTATLTNPSGSTTSAAATLNVITTSNPGRLTNLSIRANAATGAQTLIVGAVVRGGDASRGMPALLRVSGPSLAQFDVPGTLPNPQLSLLVGEDAVVAANDDWAGDATITTVGSRVGAFGFASASSLDAALFRPSLTSGSYTMWANASPASAANAQTGVVLAEIYDATVSTDVSPTMPRLVNVSARTQSGAGDTVLICGFAIGGETSKTVLIRGIGPTLAAFGVPGTLADPKLELFQGNTSLNLNDNWGGTAALTSAFDSVGAFKLDASTKDAVLLVTLPPGSYTAQVSGVGATTGVALVEVYAMNP